LVTERARVLAVRVDHDDVRGRPSVPDERLQEGRDGTRLPGTSGANDGCVPQNEPTSVKADRHFVCGGETSKPKVIVIGLGENGPEIVCCGEMDGVVKPRVRAHASLEAARPAIDLPKELNLKPSLPRLDDLRRSLGPGEFRDSHEAYGGDQVDQPLRDTYERPDLPDLL